MKVSAGAIAYLATASRGDAQPSPGIPSTDPAPSVGGSDFFNEENFPDAVLRQPGLQLTRDKTRLLLVFREKQTTATMQPLLKAAGLILEDSVNDPSALPHERINHSKRHFWVRKVQPPGNNAPIDEQSFKPLTEALQTTLYWIGPVYRLPNSKGRAGLLCPIPNVLLLKLDPQIRDGIPTALEKILTKAQLQEMPERSKYLRPFRYFVVKNPGKRTVYTFQKQVLEDKIPFVQEARFENSPLLDPAATPPNDTSYGAQWNLQRIDAEAGWTICSGRNDVVVWILDEGVDTVRDCPSEPALAGPHPDIGFMYPGINLVTKENITNTCRGERPDLAHGTQCAGIVGAVTNNGVGIAGVAGGSGPAVGCNAGCQIYPLVFYSWPEGGVMTDTQVAEGFSFAALAQLGLLQPTDDGYQATTLAGSVLSFSYANRGSWDTAVVDPAIEEAFKAGIVICASSGNEESAGVAYPASHPNVIACGASDTTDNRKHSTAASNWGSSYGEELSVVAPGVDIPTTDPQDVGGAQVGILGSYHMTFGGTSAATPHVAGLAALLLSKYPNLTPTNVRTIIERTAKKVGSHVVPSSTPPRYPVSKSNGSWHEEMGYGLINIAEALNFPPTDFADVMIRDNLDDSGSEPSSGVSWESPDIVIHPNLSDPFDDTDRVVRGQDNYLFIRVMNLGPLDARNVTVDARIVPYVGTQFIYPYDWKVNPTHVRPVPLTTTFATVRPGIANQVTATFKIPPLDVDTLWDWTQLMSWHPCVLAEVTADNDYSLSAPILATGNPTAQRNNLAQRNVTVVFAQPRSPIKFPFLMGTDIARLEMAYELLIELGLLPPGGMPILLALDEAPAPLAKFGKLENVGDVTVKGGNLVSEEGRRTVVVKDFKTVVRMKVKPGQRYGFTLKTEIPQNAKKGQKYVLRISQRTQNEEAVGGATVIFTAK